MTVSLSNLITYNREASMRRHYSTFGCKCESFGFDFLKFPKGSSVLMSRKVEVRVREIEI